jgi:hypothetical protein
MRNVTCERVLSQAEYGIVLAGIAAAAYRTGDLKHGNAEAENAYATVA